MSLRHTLTAAGGQGKIGRTMTIRVPMNLRKRGGRKLVVVPGEGSTNFHERQRTLATAERPLVKLLARAFHWKRLFESDEYASLEQLAAAEDVDRSYLSKVLHVTLLAPSIVEAILEGREPRQLTIQRLLRGVSIGWREQKETLTVAD